MPAPHRLVTFGAPRLGFDGLADLIGDLPGARYVFQNDAVPRLPTWPFLHDRDETVIAAPPDRPRRRWWRRSILDHRI